MQILAAFPPAAALAPAFLENSIMLFSPCTWTIHQLSVASEGIQSHLVQGLHYLGKPIDRLIQAVVSVVFLTIEYFFCIAAIAEQKQYFYFGVALVAAPFIVPLLLTAGVAQFTLLAANAALQIVLPFQTVYAVVKGKEACLEYFDYRRHVKADNVRKIYQLPERNVKPPLVSLADIILKNPVNQAFQGIFKGVGKKKEINALKYIDSGKFMPLLRTLAVV